MSYKQQMTFTIVKVIWAYFGSISTRLKRNLLIFKHLRCGRDSKIAGRNNRSNLVR